MEFTFLGTSSGVPCKTRNVTSLALSADKGKAWYMVDCGEATQHQLLNTRYSVSSLKAIFITHVHGDHCYGLPGILASASMSGRSEPLTIVGPADIAKFVRGVQEATQLWLDFELIFIDVAEQQQISFDDVEVEAFELSHRVPCWGYNFVEAHVERQLDKAKLNAAGVKPGPLWGKLQKGLDVDDGQGNILKAEDFYLPPRTNRVVAVCGDNDNPQLLNNLAHKPHVVVHESTYTQAIAEKVGPGPQHSYAGQIACYAQSAGVKNLVLTHFSPRYIDSSDASCHIGQIRDEATQYYQGRLFLARDFEHYRLNKDLQLELD